MNQGTVSADVSGGVIAVRTPWTNSGTLQAQGGTLNLNGSGSNSGTLQADTNGTLNLNGTVTSSGSVRAFDGGALNVSGNARLNVGSRFAATTNATISISGTVLLGHRSSVVFESDSDSTVTINGEGALRGSVLETLNVSGSLLGNTRNSDFYRLLGTVKFDGSGTDESPQFLEVMGQDLGNVSVGGQDNFAYGTLELSNGTVVRLVDQSDNAGGGGAEAIYVNALLVPAGTTLDLNGLHLYARALQIDGTVLGGEIGQTADGGTILLGVATPGSIAEAGEVDEWSFFGRAGRLFKVSVNPGASGSAAALSPVLGYVEVRLLDAEGQVVATASNQTVGSLVTHNDVVLPDDGEYRVQVFAPAAHANATGNYTLTVWDVTPDVSDVSFNRAVNGQIEGPFSIDRWTFSAVANQQVRFDLLNASSSGSVFDLTGPQGWVGFANRSVDSNLLTLPTSGNYVVTAHSADEQTGNYAFQLLAPQIELILGTPYVGAFAGSGQSEVFRVQAPAKPLLFELDDASGSNRIELYAKFGSAPTRGDFDFRSTATGANPKLVVPNAAAGNWFILAYAESVPVPAGFALQTAALDIVLASVTPDHYGQSDSATLTLTGAAFDAQTVVELVAADGTAYANRSVDVDGYTQLTAVFDLTSVPTATYSVRVRRPGGITDSLPDAFTVVSGNAAAVRTNLIVPNTVGRRALATIEVEVSNTGDVAMPAPLLVLHGTDRPLLTLNRSLLTSGFWTSAIPDGYSDTVQFLASGATPGLLQPGEALRIPVYYAGILETSAFPNVEFTLSTLDVANTSPIDWDELKDGLRPPSIRTDAWDVIYTSHGLK